MKREREKKKHTRIKMFEVKDVGNKHYQNDGTNCEHLK